MGVCTCTATERCGACEAWEQAHPEPKRSRTGLPVSPKCVYHRRFQAGCGACQAANRKYYGEYRRLRHRKPGVET